MAVGLQGTGASVLSRGSAASTEAFLARLAVAFADPVRLKIITELFQREMSPSQFQSSFGGGSLEGICRQFKKLEQHGWLRFVRQEVPAGKARPERFFRAPELAVFDEAIWDLLPQSLKEEFSWRIFVQFAERVKWAFEAETIDARNDRHFTWTPLVLDDRGRSMVFSAVTDLFYSLIEEQRDAKLRLDRSGEAPFHATVGYSAFDSPTDRRNRSGLVLPPTDSKEEDLDRGRFFVRVSKILRYPVNLKIMTELSQREMSVSQFHREFGDQFELDQRDLHRRFGGLAADGWLEISREDSGGRRRGATERFYRATGRKIFGNQSWSQVPEVVRKTYTWRVFEQMAEQVREAMAAETFDKHSDRAHTWMALQLDERGWKQVCAATEAIFDFVHEEERRSAVRLGRPGAGPPRFATVCLSVFESPKDPPSRAAESEEPWVY